MNSPALPIEQIPLRLGRYRVYSRLGEGGMASVYLAARSGPPQPLASQVARRGPQGTWTNPPVGLVALKVIREEYSLNHDFVNMFLDEATIVSRLSHPNIVRVYELGNEGTRLFIAMELLSGQSLWHLWNACRSAGIRLRSDLAAYIGARVAEGLHHAHQLVDARGVPQNLVHRDLNASNIFITYDGEVKIIDFGLAKAKDRVSQTAAGVVKGKLAYMSPEQAVGQVLDRRSDIFTLGTTLWEITVDKRLFKGTDDVDTLKRVYAASVPDPRELALDYPPELSRILRRALARERDHRYPTALEMARDLDAFSRSQGRIVDHAAVAEVMTALFRDEAGYTHAPAATPLRDAGPRRAFPSILPPAEMPKSTFDPRLFAARRSTPAPPRPAPAASVVPLRTPKPPVPIRTDQGGILVSRPRAPYDVGAAALKRAPTPDAPKRRTSARLAFIGATFLLAVSTWWFLR